MQILRKIYVLILSFKVPLADQSPADQSMERCHAATVIGELEIEFDFLLSHAPDINYS
jgi:hypothetical protein